MTLQLDGEQIVDCTLLSYYTTWIFDKRKIYRVEAK
jgi:hypothetical protein